LYGLIATVEGHMVALRVHVGLSRFRGICGGVVRKLIVMA
jgi:hypothetical protein